MSIGIGLGIAGFPFSGPAAFLRWVDLCEASAIDSIWVSDRLVSDRPTLEPLATFGLIASRTRRLKFGMNAIVLPFRDPLVLAKECATLDYLSEGRLLPAFGVGAEGAPEWRATARNPVGRGARSDEMLEVMTRLWAGERLSFEGQHYHFSDACISPLPVQQPLPVWIGGSGPAAIRRTARYGTGWLGGVQSAAQVKPVVNAIKSALLEHGRTIDEDHYGAGFTYRFGSADDPIVERAATALRRIGASAPPEELMAVGGPGEVLARLGDYIHAGVSKFVLRPLGDDDDDLMLQTRRLAEEVLPQLAAR